MDINKRLTTYQGKIKSEDIESTKQKITFIYSTKLVSKSSVLSCSSSSVPSSSTENLPFHLSNSNAAASSSLAF